MLSTLRTAVLASVATLVGRLTVTLTLLAWGRMLTITMLGLGRAISSLLLAITTLSRRRTIASRATLLTVAALALRSAVALALLTVTLTLGRVARTAMLRSVALIVISSLWVVLPVLSHARLAIRSRWLPILLLLPAILLLLPVLLLMATLLTGLILRRGFLAAVGAASMGSRVAIVLLTVLLLC